MSKKLGKIEKPSINKFESGRKLYCVPLFHILKESPDEYKDIFNRYWSEVQQHLANLEKAGRITRIYCESVSSIDETQLELIKQQNEKMFNLIKSKLDNGANMESLEDKELFDEYVDWGLCLSIARTQRVAKKILEFYSETGKKRDDHIVKIIGDTLKNEETGLLLIRDENRIRIQSQLPTDIHVFLVRPPALNDYYRWLRDRFKSAM